MDALEQYGRRNSLRLFAMVEKLGESCDQLVLDFVRHKLGVSIEPGAIDRCHRVGPGPSATVKNAKQRSIIVKLVNYGVRNEVYKHKSSFKSSGIVIREDVWARKRVDLQWKHLH